MDKKRLVDQTWTGLVSTSGSLWSYYHRRDSVEALEINFLKGQRIGNAINDLE